MADAIIPVPIYDQQFASIIDMLPSAKYIQSFSVQIMGPATISFNQALEWGMLIQVSAINVYQTLPAFFIYPNMMNAMMPTTSGNNTSSMQLDVTASQIVFKSGFGNNISGLIVFM